MGIIYKHTSPSNKSYIGQSINTIEERLRSHISSAKAGNKSRFAHAIRKYGIENFTSEVLVEVDNENLNEQEIYFIEKYDTYHNGYNSTLGGDSSGHNLSEKAKESMSKGTKKYWEEMTPEKREKHKINTSKGLSKSWKNMDEEKYKARCENISKSLKGKSEPEWKKEAHSKRMTGKGNSKAKHIGIFNPEDELMFECEGNFKVVCEDNNLPHNSLRKSHTKEGEKIFGTARGLSTAKSKDWEQYIGWYAKEI